MDAPKPSDDLLHCAPRTAPRDAPNTDVFRRAAPSLLSINTLAAAVWISLCNVPAAHLPESSGWAWVAMPLFFMANTWCLLVLPISNLVVAVGSARRFRERCAILYFLWSLPLLVFSLLPLLTICHPG
jgi:hypothetical protein